MFQAERDRLSQELSAAQESIQYLQERLSIISTTPVVETASPQSTTTPAYVSNPAADSQAVRSELLESRRPYMTQRDGDENTSEGSPYRSAVDDASSLLNENHPDPLLPFCIHAGPWKHLKYVRKSGVRHIWYFQGIKSNS